jgi:hypothetical protein
MSSRVPVRIISSQRSKWAGRIKAEESPITTIKRRIRAAAKLNV